MDHDIQVWCDWLVGNNDTWFPLVSAEPFAQLAQLATRLEGVKKEVTTILQECLSEKAFLAQPQARREEFALIKLAEDALLCEFTPWFRGLSWDSYRQYCPRFCCNLFCQTPVLGQVLGVDFAFDLNS